MNSPGTLAAVLLLASCSVPDVVGAKAFLLLDEADRPRAVLGQDQESTFLALLRPDGSRGAVFHAGAGDSSAQAVLCDASGTPRLLIAIGDRAAFIAFMDGNKKVTKVVGADQWGNLVESPNLDGITRQLETGDWLKLMREVDKQLNR